MIFTGILEFISANIQILNQYACFSMNTSVVVIIYTFLDEPRGEKKEIFFFIKSKLIFLFSLIMFYGFIHRASHYVFTHMHKALFRIYISKDSAYRTYSGEKVRKNWDNKNIINSTIKSFEVHYIFIDIIGFQYLNWI